MVIIQWASHYCLIDIKRLLYAFMLCWMCMPLVCEYMWNHIIAYHFLLDAFSTTTGPEWGIQHYTTILIEILPWYHCRWFLLSFLLSFLQSYYIFTAYDLLCFSNCEWLIDLFIVFNATFSNMSAISLRPVLVVEEAEVPGENHRPWTSSW